MTSRSPAEGDQYIRGAGGVRVDGRYVARILLGLAVALSATFAIIFSVIAVEHNSRITSLQKHGAAVEVTVTGCVGMASGTGITEAGYACRGTFTLERHRYNAAIGGTADLLTVGQTLRAIAVRSNPSVLYTASSVSSMHASWTGYVTPALLLVVVLLAAELFRRKLPPRESA